MKFIDYFAVGHSRSRCYFSFEHFEEKYFENGYIHIYGIPEGLSEDDIDDIYDGNSGKAVYIGEILGYLILGDRMTANGEDILDLCDSVSSDLAYVVSSLISDDLIDIELGICTDIYYISELEMEKEYDLLDIKVAILEKLPYILLSLYHVHPGILAYYPLPLEFSDEEALVPKHNVSLSLDPHITEEEIIADIKVNDDQLDMLENGGLDYSPYPVSVKNKELWEVYEAAGFEEVGRTRLLYKEVLI